VRHFQHLFGSLTTYIDSGHPVSLQTTHGEREGDNCITFLIGDWTAFVAALEPGTVAR